MLTLSVSPEEYQLDSVRVENAEDTACSIASSMITLTGQALLKINGVHELAELENAMIGNHKVDCDKGWKIIYHSQY